MPRVVRNFWIEADIDGYKSEIKGGSRSKDGGFKLKVYQRDKNIITEPLEIKGFVNERGMLQLEVLNKHLYENVLINITER